MSDRYNYLTVFLEEDIKDEDAEPLIEAIRWMRGVLKVEPNVRDPESVLAYERALQDLRKRLDKVLYPDRPV